MSEIIISGDEHIRSEEPFYSAKKDYFDWFVKQEFNKEENTLINTGDFFHSKSPTPKDYALAYSFLHRCKFNTVYILAGNGAHEINITKNTYAIQPLQEITNVEIVTDPKMINIENTSIALLPFIPSWKLRGTTMNDYYQAYIEQSSFTNVMDYVVGHFFHKDGFGDEVDISGLSGKRRMGHSHVPTEDGEYVGVNTITRADEAGIKPHLNIINASRKSEELFEVPKFLDYITLDFETDISLPEKHPNKAFYNLYNIKNAPDEQSIYNRYGGISINRWDKKATIEDVTNTADQESDEKKSLSQYFKEFIKNKKINETLKGQLRELILQKE